MTCQGLTVLIALGVTFVVGATTERDPAKSVTCTAATAYVKGTARVTCHFSSDVSRQLPVSLSVDFYRKGQNNSVSVAECFLEAGHDGCQMKVGRFSFSRPPSAGPGDMVLEIGDVTDNDAGRYVCQQMSAKRSRAPSWPCVLSVEDPPQPVRPEDPTTRIADRDQATPTLSGGSPVEGVSKGSGATEGMETAEGALDMATVLSLVLGSAAVLVIIIILVVCFLYRKRRQSQRKTKEEKTDEEKPFPTSDTAENPQDNAPDTTENPEDETLDPTENPDPEEDETEEGDPLVDKESFEMEIKLTAAVMQVPIQRKMSLGEYP